MNALKRKLAMLALCAYASPVPALAQATAVPATVDAATRGEIIDGVIREMSSHYVFPEIATQVQQQLQRQRREKAFEGIDDARACGASAPSCRR